MQRQKLIDRLKKDNKFDVIVIGGGASGLGAAFDASNRGLKTLLVERKDFAKVTSSKSTKLIHGGVRYLAQGNISLVREALHERSFIYKNAPHIARDMSFILPCYNILRIPFYYIGLKMYDALAGFPKHQNSKYLSKKETLKDLPYLKDKSLKGSILYHDGAFDDARLAITLALGIIDKGDLAINYVEAVDFIKKEDKIVGVNLKDNETGEELVAYANCVINATGVFVDELMQKDDPKAQDIVEPSQGVHLILRNVGIDITCAMLVPKTKDGRVLFIVPWYDNLILGTTDTPMKEAHEDCVALQEEVDFIISTANDYFKKTITYKDIISVYAGQRPLIKAGSEHSTKKLSREEGVVVSKSGLVTVAGGKWTTYRAMAEHVLNEAIKHNLIRKSKCTTSKTHLYGYTRDHSILAQPKYLRVYGADLKKLEKTPGFNQLLHEDLPYNKAQVLWAIKHEYARSVEDVLARRLRALFINAKAALEVAPYVADVLQEHLAKDDAWKEEQLVAFNKLAKTYTIDNYTK